MCISFILKDEFQFLLQTGKWVDLFMLLHGGVEFLGKIIGYIRHPRLLFIGSAHAALIFIGLLVVLLFCIFAITLCTLPNDSQRKELRKRSHAGYMLLSRETRSTPREFQRQLYSLPSSAPPLPVPIP